MLDDFISKAAQCESKLQQGFKHESNLAWLNELSELLLGLFNSVHKYMVFDVSNGNLLETCFLCTSQITTCVKSLELVLKTESISGTVQMATRQFFLDRAIFCLSRLREIITAGECPPLNEQNFTNLIDVAFDLVTEFSENGNTNNIRQTVELLISQALAFMQVTLNDDKSAIAALSQKVLTMAISVDDTLSFSEKDRQLYAQLLETALYQLENTINESVLRLLYQIFLDLLDNPIQNIRNLHKISPNSPAIDELIANFDITTDRLVQIGLFALAFADNRKIVAVVRSCLASLESLEMELVPSLLSENCETHSKLLEQHWRDEVNVLETQITKIIDSSAFCKSLIDIVDECVQEKTFDKSAIGVVVAKSKIFYRHLEMNEDLLNLREEGTVKFCFNDFNLILKECEAAVDYIGKIDDSRIIKRIKVLKSTLKKLEKALSINKSIEDEKPIEKVNATTENVPFEDSVNFFTSHNIRATSQSILYRTKNARLDSKLSSTENEPTARITRITGKARNSLRVAMFKRSKDLVSVVDTPEVGAQNAIQDSMGLNITDILYQLTDLSNSFSKDCAIDSTILEKDCKIIIKIRNDS